jgi:hypothetical protein
LKTVGRDPVGRWRVRLPIGAPVRGAVDPTVNANAVVIEELAGLGSIERFHQGIFGGIDGEADQREALIFSGRKAKGDGIARRGGSSPLPVSSFGLNSSQYALTSR